MAPICKIGPQAQARAAFAKVFALYFLTRMFGDQRDRTQYLPLYQAVVQAARDSFWYREGSVPDTIDGRFDMIAAVLALVLIRLEHEGAETKAASALLAELFIEDMDGSLRQLGIGDLMVGKHIGRMMGAVGGRIAAFRPAVEGDANFESVVRRNIFHDAPPTAGAVTVVSGRLEGFHRALAETPAKAVLHGDLPKA